MKEAVAKMRTRIAEHAADPSFHDVLLETSWAAFPDFVDGLVFTRREAILPKGVYSGAVFDPSESYRYLLWRCWDPQRPPLVCCCLNPSKATEVDPDNTVEKLTRWARVWGFGGVIVVNAFALRSTNPMGLYGDVDPVGGISNDLAIAAAAKVAGRLMCGWGRHAAHPRFKDRTSVIKRILLEHVPSGKIYATKINKDGTPKHPLYEPNAVTPIVYATR